MLVGTRALDPMIDARSLPLPCIRSIRLPDALPEVCDAGIGGLDGNRRPSTVVSSR